MTNHLFSDGYKKKVTPLSMEETELTGHLMKFAVAIVRSGLDLQQNKEASAAADSIYQLFRRVMAPDTPDELAPEDIVLSEFTVEREQ